jgi:hypothetical protein
MLSIKWMVLLCIRQFQAQISNPETGYPDWGFRDLPQLLQATAGSLKLVKNASILFNYLLFSILSFNAMLSECPW